MPKFKVILMYTHNEIVEVEAENEEAAFNEAVALEPDEVWDYNLLDYDVQEME